MLVAVPSVSECGIRDETPSQRQNDLNKCFYWQMWDRQQTKKTCKTPPSGCEMIIFDRSIEGGMFSVSMIPNVAKHFQTQIVTPCLRWLESQNGPTYPGPRQWLELEPKPDELCASTPNLTLKPSLGLSQHLQYPVYCFKCVIPTYYSCRELWLSNMFFFYMSYFPVLEFNSS